MSPVAPRRPERPFTLPDRYRLGRHIASGGMASVWCADDLVLDRKVAIKVLAERFAHDGPAVARFTREARAAARVSGHPHVVTVYDIGELADCADPLTDATHPTGRGFIVMEFLAGGTVADAIHHDSVRRREALRWLREAASALDDAHSRGIVHRDIKPANFLLDRGRVLHVADFGIARLTTEETITTSDQLFGTAAYLSPEQALGREATGASDRYALAIAAYELLTGERPFSAAHFSAQARQHIEEPPPPASEIDATLPPAVDEVLFAGLAKDPAARPESAEALVTGLSEALAGHNPGLGRRAPRRRTPVRAPDPAGPAASTAAARQRPDTRPPSASATGGRPGHPRIYALGALVIAAALITGVAIASLAGGRHPGTRVAVVRVTAPAAGRHHRAATQPAARHHVAHAPRPKPATTPAVLSPEQLQDAGYREMLAGDYTAAIPNLRAAVSTAPAGSDTYAYALYNLGRSEVLSGDPQAAIPILRQRLQIPDQQATVKALLAEAIVQAGDGDAATTTTATTPSAPTTTAPANGEGSGGAGLGNSDRNGRSHDNDGAGSGPDANASRSARHHHGGLRPLVALLTAAAND
jgi:tetratricopeptide (TPR) repeat protein